MQTFFLNENSNPRKLGAAVACSGLALFCLYAKDAPYPPFDMFGQLSALDLMVVVIAALSLTLLLRLPMLGQISNLGYFLLSAVLITAIHFRFSVYFQWDDWGRLLMLLEGGFQTAFQAHNGHFKPLFFLWYYSLVSLFRAHYEFYILIGVLIHAINTVLVAKLLERFTAPFVASPKRVARMLALLFALSGLNTAVLQWAFLHCILLCQTAILGSALFAWSYLQSGKKTQLIASSFCAALSPLFFANGFFVFPLLVLVLTFNCFLNRDQSALKHLVNRSLIAALAIACLLTPLGVYYASLANASAGQGVNIVFLFLGSEVGTLLRGAGVLPYMQVSSPHDLTPKSWNISPELLWIALGVTASLLPSLYCLISRRKPGVALGLWLIGQLWLLSAYLLPTVARSADASFALFPRYTYFALPALFVISIPIFFTRASEQESKSKKMNIRSLAGTLLLFVHLSVQLQFALTFNYFTEHGRRARNYMEALVVDDSSNTNFPKIPADFPAILYQKQFEKILHFLRD